MSVWQEPCVTRELLAHMLLEKHTSYPWAQRKRVPVLLYSEWTVQSTTRQMTTLTSTKEMLYLYKISVYITVCVIWKLSVDMRITRCTVNGLHVQRVEKSLKLLYQQCGSLAFEPVSLLALATRRKEPGALNSLKALRDLHLTNARTINSWSAVLQKVQRKLEYNV